MRHFVLGKLFSVWRDELTITFMYVRFVNSAVAGDAAVAVVAGARGTRRHAARRGSGRARRT